MRYSPLAVLLALALAATTAAPPRAAEPAADPLADRVRDAIKGGVRYLEDVENKNGNWKDMPSHPGGLTSLALLALLNCGVDPKDEMIQRGLTKLREVKSNQTYVVSLQTMVFCLAGEDKDAERIRKNVDWLLEARRPAGWGYTKNDSRTGPLDTQADHSNTQFALLALHEAHLSKPWSGVSVPPEVWKSIREMYVGSQHPQGFWAYGRNSADKTARDTMTTAGLCGLLITGMDLNAGREKPLGDGTFQNCGAYEANRPVVNALDWVGKHFPPPEWGRRTALQYTYYRAYGIERAGRLSGLRFFGEHDWYREGCEFLVAMQKEKKYWDGRELHGIPSEPDRFVATCFAMLFLSKGATPVLISKLAHSGARYAEAADWNNDRNDARHLVAYAGANLFKKQPLAWQVFDVQRARPEGAEGVRLVTAELLQSPIAYFNGHQAPSFTDGEMKVLREFVENGGFILADACCGRKEFHDGFLGLMKKLFDDLDDPLKPLPPSHPVYTAAGPKFEVNPNQFPLLGVQKGCKTVVIYSPRDLSCWWEANEFGEGKGRDAFRMGANIIAYATGLELPKARLTQVEVPSTAEEKSVPRGYLKVAQLRHAGDWQPAPRAMRNLMTEVRDPAKLGLDVALETKEMPLGDPNLLDYRFLYMHGRNEFKYPEGEGLKKLKFNLETGGLLFADACCGAKRFDAAFRQFVKDLWPDGKYKLEPIPLSDELFSAELNGAKIETVRCRREGADGKAEAEPRSVAPALEGVKVNGRWAIIYSKYDIGCALEKHKSSDCLGHDYASAVTLGKAAVLYATTR